MRAIVSATVVRSLPGTNSTAKFGPSVLRRSAHPMLQSGVEEQQTNACQDIHKISSSKGKR